MGIRERITAAYKAFRYPGEGGGGRSLSSLLQLPGSHQDWEAKAGKPWKSSAAAIGIDWIARSYPEARLSICRDEARETVYDAEAPLARLVRRPNPYYGGRVLWQATVLSKVADGNAYWLRNKDAGTGTATRELVYIPHWMIEPRWTQGGGSYIDWYDYMPGNGTTLRLRPDEVVHFRYGCDPENTRKGLSPLRAQLRAIGADNEVNTYVAVVLENLGILGYVVSPTDSTTQLDAEGVKKTLEARSTGDNRGRFTVLDGSVKIDALGFSPEQLALDRMADLPAARILGGLHIDPMAVGLTAEHSTFNNFTEAKRAAWENAVLPSMAEDAEALDIQLLPEFTADPRAYCWFDTRKVAALQDDVDKRHARARSNFVAGFWTRAEARVATDKEPGPTDDVYMTDIQDARAAATAERQAAALVAAPAAGASDGAGATAKKAAEGPTDWAERVAAELEALHAASA